MVKGFLDVASEEILAQTPAGRFNIDHAAILKHMKNIKTNK